MSIPPVGEPLEVETYTEPSAPVSPERSRKRLPNWATIAEAAVFLAFAIFFITYGETPYLGGDGLGLHVSTHFGTYLTFNPNAVKIILTPFK